MEKYNLETKRLQLVPFIPEDAKKFQLLNNDVFIRKYLWDDKVIDAIAVDEIMDQNIMHFEQDQFGLWRIHLKGKNTLIGYTGLWYFFDEPQPQLIYALLQPFTQKGYATEASPAVLEYAFEVLGLTYLLAATDEPHLASQKVAQRLGMSFLEKRIEDNKPTVIYKIKNKL